MGFFKNLFELYRSEQDKRRKQKEKYRIEYAFTCGGTKYYRFADIANLPYERGLQAMVVYKEVTMQCDRTYLQDHVKAMDKILSSNNINIYNIKTLNDFMKQRLALPTDVDLLYKLASVCFFDETENPCTYEPAYAEKKIAKWRKDKGVTDFFSQTPLLELMPFLQRVDVDLSAYTPINNRINKEMKDALQTILSDEKSKPTKGGKTS